ncbi:MAG TPA: thiamine pyrophosphate-dependent dehydrogenase E1 component subunit alpha [Capillimicrobium sp.]|nr:thiamine pyrophosphate-dependent dehydrogenase E1 component subunit alpha [Capillimicrobium sp.]
MAELSDEQLVDLYRQMCRMRAFDERIAVLYRQGKVRGTAHAYTGMEAIAAGVCGELRPDDMIASTHRGHGHCIGKGLDPKRMMAELLGRADGYCGGKGGSLHLTAVEHGMLGADGVVGGSFALAVGAAYAKRQAGEDTVVVVFFGDGAANEGLFHESANLAAITAAPVIFVCENNAWALSTRTTAVTAGEIADRAAGYGFPGVSVDGNDVLAVREAVLPLIERARAGEGPSLLEAHTYRMMLHSLYSSTGETRPADELEHWAARDPIVRLRPDVVERVGEARVDAIDEEVVAETEAAVEFALASPVPDDATAFADVYSPTTITQLA